MDLLSIIAQALGSQQFLYLVLLCAAVFVMGVAAALVKGELRIANLVDVAEHHLIPTALIYCAVSVLAAANPQLGTVRDAIFYALAARLVADVLANLDAFGIDLPAALTDKFAPVTFVQHADPPTPPTPPAAT